VFNPPPQPAEDFNDELEVYALPPEFTSASLLDDSQTALVRNSREAEL